MKSKSQRTKPPVVVPLPLREVVGGGVLSLGSNIAGAQFGEMCDNERMAPGLSSRSLAGTRDAVLVHGLALLAAAIGITLAILLRPNDAAFCLALGVALAATGVLLVWALTLAARAWRRSERSGWAWAVMVLGSLEILLLGIIFFLIRSGAPLWSSPLESACETGW